MPVETLRPSDGRLAMPFRILNKGPEYFRRQAEPGAHRLSAVERLEADKAKYVKSQQVALTRQAPVKPPIIRKPLLSPAMMQQCHIATPPARKAPRRPNAADSCGARDGLGGRRGATLNLEVLNNLINNVCEGPAPCPRSSLPSSPTASSPSSGAKSAGSSFSAEPSSHLKLSNNGTSSCPSSCTSSSPPQACRPPPVPARAPRVRVPVPYSSPNTVTVRRVDVRPHTEAPKPLRVPLKPYVKPRQIAQPQAPPPPPPAQNPPSSQNPQPRVLSSALPSPPVYLPPSPMLARAGMIPPASPAFTRLSNASSRGSRAGSARKHPSLHRSKSDLSDRYSRATADLERFFNYCGLDPCEVDGMGGVERFARANSDIVSVSKLRSVSTPSSEGGDEAREEGGEGEEEGPGGAAGERVPYGISVIERNARVIKWLYGIRQARDAVSNV